MLKVSCAEYFVKFRPGGENIRILEGAFADILDWPVFIVWKLMERDGKPAKVPCNATGKPVSVHESWLSFDQAVAAFKTGPFDGVGVKLGCGDDQGYLCGIDLDARDAGTEALEKDLELLGYGYGFSDTYAEYSPSGLGAHILFWAKLPDGEFVSTTGKLPHGTRIEIYAITEEKRFFTITGAKLDGFQSRIQYCTQQLARLREEFSKRPETAAPQLLVGVESPKGPVPFHDLPAELQEIILQRARRDPKFSYLFNQGFNAGAFIEIPSQSEADLYLCRALVPELRRRRYPEEKIFHQVDLAMRASRLYRPKWDERRGEKTYGVLTLEAALREKPFPPIEVVGAERILAGEFDPPREVLRGLLVEGLTLCGGWPKSGKTWLALEASLAVSTGRAFLGRFDAVPGKVLYFAFEEGEPSLRARLKTLIGAEGLPEGAFSFAFRLLPLTDGGVEQLADFLSKAPGVSLVVLDPLVRARAKRKTDGNLYEEDYRALEGLQDLAKETHVAFLVIHHLRKAEAPDPILSVSGSTGLLAVADTIWVLERGRGGVTVLHVRGRNVRQEELAIRFEGTGWRFLGDARPYRLPPHLQEVFAALPSGVPVTLGELAEKVGLRSDVLRKRLRELMDLGLVEQEARGRYRLLPPAFENGGGQ